MNSFSNNPWDKEFSLVKLQRSEQKIESIFLECKLASKSLLEKKPSLPHRQCTHMPFNVSIHGQKATCFSEPQLDIWVVHHPTQLSALTKCPVSLWSRFGQVLDEPDTAYDSRQDVLYMQMLYKLEVNVWQVFLLFSLNMKTLRDTHSSTWSSLLLFPMEHCLSVDMRQVTLKYSAFWVGDWSLDIFIPLTIHPSGLKKELRNGRGLRKES